MGDEGKVHIGWKEIAARVGVKERTARQWAEEEGLPVRVRVDVFRMSERDLLKWLEQKEVPYAVHIAKRRTVRVLRAA